jgi:hypothetical protein
MTRQLFLWGAGVLVALALAILGVILYARNPDVGTYWLNALLIAPLFGIVMYGLHRALPMRLQWVGACVMAPLGGIAYLLWPNEQWWNYGALTAMPLMLLAIARETRIREERGEEPEHWYGGLGDGPWGPP